MRNSTFDGIRPGLRQRCGLALCLAAALVARAALGARSLHDAPAAVRERTVRAATSLPPPAEGSAGIRTLLAAQVAAWNRGNLEEFVEGYWNSAATTFAGTQGILHGRQALLERYRRSYPDRGAMGTLAFTNLEITLLCPDAAFTLGEWRLARAAGPVGGVFSLVLRRFPEGWRIIADHTSVVPRAAGTPGN